MSRQEIVGTPTGRVEHLQGRSRSSRGRGCREWSCDKCREDPDDFVAARACIPAHLVAIRLRHLPPAVLPQVLRASLRAYAATRVDACVGWPTVAGPDNQGAVHRCRQGRELRQEGDHEVRTYELDVGL